MLFKGDFTTTMSENTEIDIPIVEILVTLTPSSSLRESEASKIDWLYEVPYLNESKKISPTTLSIVNPCYAFAKHASSFSPIRSIRQLICHISMGVKEYAQSAWFDQYPILAAQLEHFVAI